MFIRQLTYLVAIDRFRHFSRAAEHCGVSQPALSSAIRQLENELGVTIIRRRQRVLGFTPEGERVLAWARQSLSALDGLRQEAGFAHDIASGKLSIGIMPPAQQLAPLIAESLRSKIPALHLTITVLANSEILTGLAEQRLDLGIAYMTPKDRERSVESVRLYQEEYALVAGPGIPLPGKSRCSWAQAAKLPLCLLDQTMRSRQNIDAYFGKAKAIPEVLYETNSLALLHAELGNNRLASVLPAEALPALTSSQGMQIRRLDQASGPDVCLVRARQPINSALLQHAWKIVSDLQLGDRSTAW